MKNWREIVSDIEDALSDYDCTVTYVKKSGRDYYARCSYFEVEIDDEYDCDDIENELENVSNDWELTIDWDSESDVDLNASWDV